MSSQIPIVYLLNLNPGTVGVIVTDETDQQTASFVMSPYYYVNISFLLSSNNDTIEISAPSANINQAVISGFPSNVQTVTLIIQNGSVSIQFDTPEDILQSYLYNNILKNMNSDLTKIYQDLTTLISQYASGQTLSQSLLSDASSVLQDLNNMLQNAIQFVTKTVIKSDVVSVLQQVYNNLNQISVSYTHLTLPTKRIV